ncbi:hypothetical protein ACFODZ_03585 [Marinicella sediminis]|uniref:DUF2306 domain-containing protein n=1 Tax=Marinicella sediminis TaxID=1792834 RepID=A0ABV7J5I1_9GAMM|nr:hypothetical protein [Marinicella sediminis]
MNLTPIGWLHTIVGIMALVAGVCVLWQHKRLSYRPRLGQIYLLATVITAASSLTIFNHGGFNVAHGLGILTVLAVLAGVIIEKTVLFKSWNKFFTNLCYSATILFHLLPTTTEIMTRFPPDHPLVSSLKDPLLHKTFLVITAVFLIMLIWQMLWLRNQPNEFNG